LAHVAELSQTPVRRLAPAFNTETAAFGHDYETVVAQLSEATGDRLLIESRLIGGVAGRQINSTVVPGVEAVARLERDIEQTGVWRCRPPGCRFPCLDKNGHERSLDPSFFFARLHDGTRLLAGSAGVTSFMFASFLCPASVTSGAGHFFPGAGHQIQFRKLWRQRLALCLKTLNVPPKR